MGTQTPAQIATEAIAVEISEVVFSESNEEAHRRLAAAVLDALAAAGYAVIKPSRHEYTLGWLADTGIWCTLGQHPTHPWLSEMQRQLAEHAGDPDWGGVEVIGRPVIAWTPAVSLPIETPTGEE